MKIGDRVEVTHNAAALERYHLDVLAGMIAGRQGFLTSPPVEMYGGHSGKYWQVDLDLCGPVRVDEMHLIVVEMPIVCRVCGSKRQPVDEMGAFGIYYACADCHRPV